MDIEDLIRCIKVEYINPKTNFWMIRTKKGFFYDEFINEEFVALGWNTINEDRIKNIDKDKRNELKVELEHKYPKNKQTSQTINKCIRFIREINEGDIIMIPSAKNSKITFATAGEYYEDNSFTYENEIETIETIDSGIDYAIEIKCPYKKRRKIKILKTVEGKKINVNLYQVLASYHGISDINSYADYILSSIYNIYCWNNKMNMVFNINKEGEIGAIDLSSFMYNSSCLLSFLDNNVNISTKANLNSPGQLILSFLQEHAADAVKFLSSYSIKILLIWMAIVGGKFGPIEFPSFIELVMKIREHNSKLIDAKLDQQLKEIQIEHERQEIMQQNQLIASYLKKIQTSSDNLQIDKDDACKIINFESYHQKKDE